MGLWFWIRNTFGLAAPKRSPQIPKGLAFLMANQAGCSKQTAIVIERNLAGRAGDHHKVLRVVAAVQIQANLSASELEMWVKNWAMVLPSGA